MQGTGQIVKMPNGRDAKVVGYYASRSGGRFALVEYCHDGSSGSLRLAEDWK